MLSLSLFTSARDLEAAQYRVLAGLREIRSAFARNQVYPHLGDLVRLHAALREIAERTETLREHQPRALKGLDLEEGRLVYEEPEEPLLFEALIRWALPLLVETIEEGRAIYEFVEEHTQVEAVGIVPSYQDEGYLFVPDRAARPSRLRVLRYAVSIFTAQTERYRSLRTAPLEDAPAEVSPLDLKRFLITRHPDLPNPATYRLALDLDFPVEETVLPVAKRKLLQYLTLRGSAGTA